MKIMYRLWGYGFIGGLVGLIVGVAIAGTFFPADASGNPNPLSLPVLVLVTLICIGVSLWFASAMNKNDPDPNAVAGRSYLHSTALCMYGSMFLANEVLDLILSSLLGSSFSLSAPLVIALEVLVLSAAALLGALYASWRGYLTTMGSAAGVTLYVCGVYTVATVVANLGTFVQMPVLFLDLFAIYIPVALVIWYTLSKLQADSNTIRTF